MNKILIGCGPFPTRREKAFEDLGLAEILETSTEPIGLRTLGRWRVEAPEGFEFVLAASRWISVEPLDVRERPEGLKRNDFGLFRDTEANRKYWEETRAQAVALGAAAVLFQTSPGFSPSQENIDNLRNFRESIMGKVPFELVWEARGIWGVEEHQALAAELGMTAAQDPHREHDLPEPGQGGYYAITAPAGHVRFGEDDFWDLNSFLDDHEGTVRVVFRGNERERNAHAFLAFRQKLSGEGGAEETPVGG